MSLLASFHVRMEPIEPGRGLLGDTGIQARGLAYDLFAEADARLAQKLHDADDLKPFTCSRLLGRRERGPHGEDLLAADTYRLRYTALTEEVADAFSQALYRRQATGDAIELGGAPFRVRRVVTASEEDPLARAVRWADLAQVPPRDTWRLSFISPTAFRQHAGHLPLPLPESLFGSCLDRWNAFCPQEMRVEDDFREVVRSAIFPVSVDVRTQRVPLRYGCFVGFTGRADFTAVTKMGARSQGIATALMEFAHFCGAGHGVTRGWGQVAVRDSVFRRSESGS